MVVEVLPYLSYFCSNKLSLFQFFKKILNEKWYTNYEEMFWCLNRNNFDCGVSNLLARWDFACDRDKWRESQANLYSRHAFIIIIITIIIIIITIIIIIIIIYSLEFFTSALADGLSLEFEWQQVSSSLQDFSQYSGLSQQCCSLDGLQPSSDFQVLQSL